MVVPGSSPANQAPVNLALTGTGGALAPYTVVGTTPTHTANTAGMGAKFATDGTYRRSANLAWQPATSFPHTIAVMATTAVQPAVAGYSVIAGYDNFTTPPNQAAPLAYILLNGEAGQNEITLDILGNTTEVYLSGIPWAGVGEPFIFIATWRSTNDTTLVLRNLATGVVTTLTHADATDAAITNPTGETVGGHAPGGTIEPGASYSGTVHAYWAWNRGMTAAEAQAFVMNPFGMIAPKRKLSSLQSVDQIATDDYASGSIAELYDSEAWDTQPAYEGWFQAPLDTGVAAQDPAPGSSDQPDWLDDEQWWDEAYQGIALAPPPDDEQPPLGAQSLPDWLELDEWDEATQGQFSGPLSDDEQPPLGAIDQPDWLDDEQWWDEAYQGWQLAPQADNEEPPLGATDQPDWLENEQWWEESYQGISLAPLSDDEQPPLGAADQPDWLDDEQWWDEVYAGIGLAPLADNEEPPVLADQPGWLEDENWWDDLYQGISLGPTPDDVTEPPVFPDQPDWLEDENWWDDVYQGIALAPQSDEEQPPILADQPAWLEDEQWWDDGFQGIALAPLADDEQPPVLADAPDWLDDEPTAWEDALTGVALGPLADNEEPPLGAQDQPDWLDDELQPDSFDAFLGMVLGPIADDEQPVTLPDAPAQLEDDAYPDWSDVFQGWVDFQDEEFSQEPLIGGSDQQQQDEADEFPWDDVYQGISLGPLPDDVVPPAPVQGSGGGGWGPPPAGWTDRDELRRKAEALRRTLERVHDGAPLTDAEEDLLETAEAVAGVVLEAPDVSTLPDYQPALLNRLDAALRSLEAMIARLAWEAEDDDDIAILLAT